MRVAIILVNYNGFDDTVDCINSIMQINYKNYEIVVVDNGSTDDLEKLIKRYHDKKSIVTVLTSGGNLGFSGGNNVGIRYALDRDFDYILLLNNDTLVEPDFLGYMLDSCKCNNSVVTSKIMYASDRNKIWYAGGNINRRTSRTIAYGINTNDAGKYDETQEVTFASGCCMLLPKYVVKTIGLLNEDYFLYCEDTDYCLRLLQSGIRIIYEPKAKIYHKVNASTRKIAGIQTYYLVRNKLYIIKRYIRTNYKILAYLYVFIESIKRVLADEYDLKSVMEGIRDFRIGNNGKK